MALFDEVNYGETLFIPALNPPYKVISSGGAVLSRKIANKIIVRIIPGNKDGDKNSGLKNVYSKT